MPRDIGINRYRNIGIMAHIDAGKTTLTERVLFYTGRIHSMGEVHQGTATMDSMLQEQKMGITISSAVTTAFWTVNHGAFSGLEHRLNIIDTPGHMDFTMEVERSLRVLDGAVAVFDGGHGVEAQTETVWRQADKYNVPRLAFMNKMDKPGADFAMCMASLRERLGVNAVPVQLPLGEGSEHRGVIDLIRERAYLYPDDGDGRVFVDCEIPEALRETVQRSRLAMIEACADVDPALMEAYVSHGVASVSVEAIERALRSGTLTSAFVPVLCGAAYRNKGVQMLLDAIVKYLPSPSDLPPVKGTHPDKGAQIERHASDTDPLCALAFKLVVDRFVGSLTYLRIYSGRIATGTTVFNPNRNRRERIGRLMRMHAAQREDVREAWAGEIVAAVGLSEARTGDTLCDETQPIVLESVTSPEPVIELAVEPKTRIDQDRLGTALQRLAMEDPSLRIATHPESGQTILRGMGELHLHIAIDRLRTDFGVEAITGNPEVAYRETLRGTATAEVRYVRQTGGPGQFGHVVIEVAPGERGTGLVFSDETHGGVIPREFVPAVEKGIRGAMSRGVLAGYPVVDVHVKLLHGSHHPNDSSTQSFEVTGSLAFRQAAERAGVCLLEPIMALEVVTPGEYVGDVIGNLNARRGEVRNTVARGNAQAIEALIPLASTFGYVMDLRGRTHGRGTASMHFAHYAIVPPTLTSQLVATA